ncbi:LOG family protein [Aurantibacter aestuarii]|uniref:Cytokinin riboside 5'-monophosphate phosphoribohydrolase n=1 Tax=Aurantibacter aestuarii TaxID=1266046 RepID=A0A2T1N9F2_9FLAO|nr:TIGR00730 family Rossman fold protein [Aurantibacter aestuarii]PSG88453.1 TIGR00730 family Rossman fold protein [Aurantibacter aestuarii]
MKNIAVFCGSSLGTDKTLIENTYNLGKTLAKNDYTLVYGGAKIGLMGTVAQACLDHKGKVIGVIPEFLQTREIVSHDLTELITTKNMHDRKVIMYEKSDGFIIIPGGFGTMDEFFEISTWGQLGLHSKPIGILNTNGFYDDLLNQGQKMADKGFLAQANFDAILVSDNISDLLQKMTNFKPLPKPEWLNLERL